MRERERVCVHECLRREISRQMHLEAVGRGLERAVESGLERAVESGVPDADYSAVGRGLGRAVERGLERAVERGVPDADSSAGRNMKPPSRVRCRREPLLCRMILQEAASVLVLLYQ